MCGLGICGEVDPRGVMPWPGRELESSTFRVNAPDREDAVGTAGWVGTRRSGRKVTLALLAVAALALPALDGAAANAAPSTAASATGASIDSYAEGHGPRDKDNRAGVAVPTASQREAASRLGTPVRWNRLGTPHALGPAPEALATGLAADPQTAARQYLIGNGDLFGLDEKAVASLETLLVRPMGAGTVVQLRQRFGDLEAGHDGLVSILVSGGSVLRVSSSLARDTRAPEPPTISASEALDVAVRDA